MTGGLRVAINRGLSYAPYADLLWCETSEPNLAEARKFAESIHEKFPNKLLAYNCSPSFNWKAKLDDATIAKFQRELGAMGYKFQFITLAGFHVLNLSMFELARAYKDAGMAAYSKVQQSEFAREAEGGLSRRQAPAVRRHRLLRPGRPVRRRRQVVNHGPERFNRGGTVRTRGRIGALIDNRTLIRFTPEPTRRCRTEFVLPAGFGDGGTEFWVLASASVHRNRSPGSSWLRSSAPTIRLAGSPRMFDLDSLPVQFLLGPCPDPSDPGLVIGHVLGGQPAGNLVGTDAQETAPLDGLVAALLVQPLIVKVSPSKIQSSATPRAA